MDDDDDNLNNVNHPDLYNSPPTLNNLQDFNAFDLLNQDLLQHHPVVLPSEPPTEEVPNAPDFIISDSLARNSKQLLFAHLFNYLTGNGHYETAKALFIENFENDLQYLSVANKAKDEHNANNVERTVLTKKDIDKMDLSNLDPVENITVNMLMQSESSFLAEWWSLLWDLHSSLNKQKVKPEASPAMPPPATRPQLVTTSSSKLVGKNSSGSTKSRGRKTAAPSPTTRQDAASNATPTLSAPQQQLRAKQAQLQQQQAAQKQQQLRQAQQQQQAQQQAAAQQAQQQQQQQQQQLLQQQAHNMKQRLLLQQQQQQQAQQHPQPQVSPVNPTAIGQTDSSINSIQQAQFIQQQQTAMINRMNNNNPTDNKVNVQNVQAELHFKQEQQKMLMAVLINGNPAQQEQAQWQLQQLQQQQNSLQLLMGSLLQQHQMAPQGNARPQVVPVSQQTPSPMNQTPQQMFNMNNNTNKDQQQQQQEQTPLNTQQHDQNTANYITDYQIQLAMLENLQRQQIAQPHQMSNNANVNNNIMNNNLNNTNNNAGDFRVNQLQQIVGSRLQQLGLESPHDPAQADLQYHQQDISSPHNIMPQPPFE